MPKKMIAIIDEPSWCPDCPFAETDINKNYIGKKSDTFCRLLNDYVFDENEPEYPLMRDDRCPLKPIIYCKDCKYNVANIEKDPLDITDYTDIVCTYFMTDGLSNDDYCSQGKEKEDV